MSQTIKNIFYKQRTDFEQSLAKRNSELSFPEGIEVMSDISYATDDSPSHRLDIYRPLDKPEQELPVVINIHGGGLILGCKEFNRYFCARFSKLGYLVISIEYRLVPDCLFFDQCEDIFSAVDLLCSHAESTCCCKGCKCHATPVADQSAGIDQWYVFYKQMGFHWFIPATLSVWQAL